MQVKNKRLPTFLMVFLTGILIVTAFAIPAAATNIAYAESGNYICIGNCTPATPTPTPSNTTDNNSSQNNNPSGGTGTDSGSGSETGADNGSASGSSTTGEAGTGSEPGTDSGSTSGSSSVGGADNGSGSGSETGSGNASASDEIGAGSNITNEVSGSSTPSGNQSAASATGTDNKSVQTPPILNATTLNGSTATPTQTPDYTFDQSSITAMWVQDLTTSLEDGDTSHLEQGSQLLPPCVYHGRKEFKTYILLSSEGNISPDSKYTLKISDPAGKYLLEIVVTPVAAANAPDTLTKADEAGLVSYMRGTTYAQSLDGLMAKKALLLSGRASLAYDSAPGRYRVNNPAGTAEITFVYLPRMCIDYDSSIVQYGNAIVGLRNWAWGDIQFGSGGSTVRNIGNIPARIQLRQDDMGFGTDQYGEWRIQYIAQLGTEGSMVAFDPEETVELPDLLPVSAVTPLNLGATVKSGTGSHFGIINIGFIAKNASFTGAWEQDNSQDYENGDSQHEIAGSQFLPSCDPNNEGMMRYYLIVAGYESSPLGVFTTNVIDPEGDFLYQVEMVPYPADRATDVLMAAETAGLVTYASGSNYNEALSDIRTGRASLYMGEARLGEAPASGNYTVFNLDAGMGDCVMKLEHTYQILPSSCEATQ